jgi:hypothetical protein
MRLRQLGVGQTIVNNAELMASSAHNVSQNVIVLGFDTEPFKTTPVPGWVQV